MKLTIYSFSQYLFRPSSTKLRCFMPSIINNELYRKINNNSIRDNPTTGFVLIRTHQAEIVARNRYCDLKQAGLSTKYWSYRLWVKLKKWHSYILHTSTSQTLSACCEIIVCACLISFSQYLFWPSSRMLRCFMPSIINNELYHKINNNSIQDNLTNGFVLIRTRQANIVVRNQS